MQTDSHTDRWTVCNKGHVHWGTNGGAGLLLRYVPKEGEPRYLLQQRSRSVDYPYTWGIPGGAIRNGETPEATAQREAMEEIGVLPSFRLTGIDVQSCRGGWNFYIVKADVYREFAAFAVRETDAVGWFTPAEMFRLPLHPGLKEWLDNPTMCA